LPQKKNAGKFLEMIALIVDNYSLLGLFLGERSLSFWGELEVGGGGVEVRRGVSVFFSKKYYFQQNKKIFKK
jgi:hypothetical protein